MREWLGNSLGTTVKPGTTSCIAARTGEPPPSAPTTRSKVYIKSRGVGPSVCVTVTLPVLTLTDVTDDRNRNVDAVPWMRASSSTCKARQMSPREPVQPCDGILPSKSQRGRGLKWMSIPRN
jgi:hypothetical protein